MTAAAPPPRKSFLARMPAWAWAVLFFAVALAIGATQTEKVWPEADVAARHNDAFALAYHAMRDPSTLRPNELRDGRTLLDLLFGDTPKDASRASSHAALVLLEAGADPNLPSRGVPPLVRAAAVPRIEIVRLLLQHGADPNVRDHEGYTALMRIGAQAGASAMAAKALLDAGADPDARAPSGYSPLQHARSLRIPELLDLVEEAHREATHVR